MPVRAVFFDFGGVVFGLDEREVKRLESEYGIPQGALSQALREMVDWEALKQHLEELVGQRLDGIEKRWPSLWRPEEEALSLAELLRAHYKVGMITNSTLEIEEHLVHNHRIAERFDDIVNSARVGVAKPDPQIFRLAASRLNVPPSSCVHIDDLEQNVQGAQEAGFHAIHYQGYLPSLVSELQRLGMEW